MTVEEKAYWTIRDKYDKALEKLHAKYRNPLDEAWAALKSGKCSHERTRDCTESVSNGFGKWYNRAYKQCRACDLVNYYGTWQKYCPRDYDD